MLNIIMETDVLLLMQIFKGNAGVNQRQRVVETGGKSGTEEVIESS